METTLSFGQHIKSLRQKTRLKQKVLAQRIGISPSYLSLVEGNKTKPSMGLLKKIATELNIEIEELILKAYEDNFAKTIFKAKSRSVIKKVLRNILSSI